MAKLGKPFFKRRPVQMIIYALIFSALSYIIIRTFAAAPNAPSIYLTPASQTLPANTTFTVAIRENSGTTPVNAVQANLSYDANLVDFVSIDASASPFTITAETSGAAGSIRIARGNTTALTGDLLVANVTFKTKLATGAAAVTFTAGTEVDTSTDNADIIGSLATNAGNGSYTIDATAPTLTINTPTAGMSINAGSTYAITATATDNTSISGVDVIIDGITKTTLTTAPYNYNWNTAGVSLGSHTVQLKASDRYGNITTSNVITVTVADKTAPTVSVTSPAANATVSGTTTITAAASDQTGGTGVAKVEFSIDGTLKFTDTTSPYSYAWDSKSVNDGSHSISVKAYDNAVPANSNPATTVTVNVDNADHTAPSTPTGLSASAASTTSVTLTWAASTDNVGVTGYRVQRNGTTVTTTSGTTLTYTNAGLTSGTTYNFTVTALDAAGNASAPAAVSATTTPRVSGDFTGPSGVPDGHVTISDLSIFLTNWNTTNLTYDLNHSNLVDIGDLSILLSNWGK